jgi:transposase
LKGEVVEQKISGKRYERLSVMALRNDEHLFVEPIIYQGMVNSQVVLAYFQKVLPTLKEHSVVIMDNASYHKSKELQNLFDQYNHILLFLPPYSPELNPIEKLWGTIKQNLRYYYNSSISLYENLSNAICQF